MRDSAVSNPHTARLNDEMSAASASLADFREALFGINDPELLDGFGPALDLGARIIGARHSGSTYFIADEVANLRSQIARRRVPREDPELGPTASLRRVRGARGALIADLDSLLGVAAEHGLAPTELGFDPPTTLEFGRAGLDGLMNGLERRLRDVESALTAIEPEAAEDRGYSAQQIGLVSFYLEKMSIEVTLAKLESSARAIVDFQALGRAVAVMSELTRDFVASTQGMVSRMTESLRTAANAMPVVVRRVAGGLRALIGRVRRNGDKATPASPPPDDGEVIVDLPAEASLRAEFRALIVRGDEAVRDGDRRAARRCFAAARKLAIGCVDDRPEDAYWSLNLFAADNRLGDVELMAGNPDRARQYYETGFACVERLLAREAGNRRWLAAFSTSHEKRGNAAVSVGDHAGARRHYEASLAIRERLSQQDTTNVRFQHDRSTSHEKLGDLAFSVRDLDEARRRYEAALAICTALALQEPENARWKREIFVHTVKLAGVANALGDLVEARRHYEASVKAGVRPARHPLDEGDDGPLPPTDNDGADDGVPSSGTIAGLRRDYEAHFAVARRMTVQEPGNAFWQHDLFLSQAALARIAEAEGERAAAAKCYAAALKIIAKLVQHWPDNLDFAQDMADVQNDLARLRAA